MNATDVLVDAIAEYMSAPDAGAVKVGFSPLARCWVAYVVGGPVLARADTEYGARAAVAGR